MSIVQVSNKRKRTDSTGGSVASVNLGSFKAPAAWTFFLQNIPATNIPPPSVRVAFAKMYHSAIAGYRSSLRQHHKITTAWDRFAVESEGDSIPPLIANTLKGPTFFFPKDLSTAGEELTAGARETYTSALKVMKKAAVDYLRACHKQNVEASEALINAESKGKCLSVDLQSYASQVIKDAGHADSNLWNAYIDAVVSALGAELSSIRFDVAALVLAERQKKAAKQAALDTAAADAEMMDSTQPIESFIKERVETAVSKRLDEQVEETDTEPKKKKQKKNKPNLETSSSNAPKEKKKEKVHVEKGNGKEKRKRKGKSKSKKSKPSESNDSD